MYTVDELGTKTKADLLNILESLTGNKQPKSTSKKKEELINEIMTEQNSKKLETPKTPLTPLEKLQKYTNDYLEKVKKLLEGKDKEIEKLEEKLKKLEEKKA